jgi:hypothetical protein
MWGKETPMGDQEHSLQDNMKTYLKQIGCAEVDWIQVAQDKIYRGSCEHDN